MGLADGMQYLKRSRKFKKGQDLQFFDSAEINRRMYFYFLNRLEEMCVTRFLYKGLPDSIDDRFLEYTLMNDGQIIWFKDEVMGLLALQTMVGGQWDIYRVPMKRKAYATNGYMNADLTPENSVIMYNNVLRTNSLPALELFAYRLYNIDRSADINVFAQRTPVLIRCTEGQYLTLKNIYMKYDGNQPVIYGDKDLDLQDKFDVLKTDAPFVANDISEYRVKVWNEALSYLGIASVQNEKQERMLMSEATSGMGSILATRVAALKMREQALDKINDMFGTHITVEFNEGVDTSVALQQQEAQVEATIAQAEAMAKSANMDVGQGKQKGDD